MDEGESLRPRREVLAGAGVVGASALAGCSEWFWSQAENAGPEQVSLTIKTVPADDDVIASTIQSQLRENFLAAGIDVTHEPVSEAELYRDVLLEGDYDVFVLKHMGFDEVDAIRGLLHSQFVSERGWQNPFHFSDVTADELLETQQTTDGESRGTALRELFEYLEDTSPYTTVAFPHRFGGARASLEVDRPPCRTVDYLDVLSNREHGPEDRPLKVGVFGEGLGQRLNPIVVDRVRSDGLLDLLYDPLVRRWNGDDVPWLADSIEWDEESWLGARVELRDGLSWHDGTDLDAEDVAFTYRFLKDTSSGKIDGGLPAPRYRSRQTLVESVTVVDGLTVQFSFDTTARPVAKRVFSIPLLPEHVWADRSEVIAERQTAALVDDNKQPVGSGLFRLEEQPTNHEILLEPFDDHPFRTGTGDRPAAMDGFSRFDGIRFQIAPSPGPLVELLVDGELDVTASPIPPDRADEIHGSSDVLPIVGSSDAFYMIGYNIHHPELSNPHFRRILSRLIDREYVVEQFLDGRGDPASSHSQLLGVRDSRWESPTEPSVTDFPGADGEISAPRVRTMFESEGYRYENDALLK
ncbi:ABC transporter substrate-binding protein [Halosolutus gelatinilyticus]|uniref:ABC transporter substrate-binding protein n=1 Tax=Halosolutus gelatinilyticus TaxID=2931975 RepID=UPI001FF217C7|nr:ABC transporter substrate-binding protein [Halosolutus gelatinilyticus]